MENPKQTIHKSLTIGGIVSIICLCVLLSIPCYFLFSSALYRQFGSDLEHVINHVERYTDADDLRDCVESGVPSERYAALQELLNGMVDDFGLAYLYIVIPDESRGVMVNVIAATSERERQAGERDLPLLAEEDGYSPQVLRLFSAVWDAQETVCFEERSEYGACYTGCRPLRASDGTTVALICADVSIEGVRRIVRSYFTVLFLLTILIGAVFVLLVLRWLRRNVTEPVIELERSARRFAESDHRQGDMGFPVFELPQLRVNNEITSLAEAIAKMSQDMKNYVAHVRSAEARARSAEEEAEDMSRIAYQDSLTHVKSKAAYLLVAEELEKEIGKGNAVFAIVMVDLNFLKQTNDTYGHDYGDDYLVGTCRQICTVFKHSPVFRFGGDEFVVVLRGQDYNDREALVAELKASFAATSGNLDLEPWERYSAAVGMSEYAPGDSVEQVFKRADESMYVNKGEMKAGR